MGAGSPAGVDTDVSAHGIVQGHAYGLLDVQEIDGNKLVKVRFFGGVGGVWGSGNN